MKTENENENNSNRYLELKKKLIFYNYSDNFSFDSLNLIEKLFFDLLETTKTFLIIKENEKELINNINNIKSNLFPLKKENIQIKNENYYLHNEIISLKEEIQKQKNYFYEERKEIENKLENSLNLNEIKNNEIIKIEKEKLRLKDAYEHLATSSLLSGGIRMKRIIKTSSSQLPSSDDNQLQSILHQNYDLNTISQINTDSQIIETLRHQVSLFFL